MSLKIASDENGPGDNEAGAPRLTPRERELPPEDQFEEEIGGIFFLSCYQIFNPKYKWHWSCP